MSEENEKTIFSLAMFKKFGDTSLIEGFLPKGYDNEDGILMDAARIRALYPAQELPENIKKYYSIKKSFSVDEFKEILKLFKKGEVITFYFAKKDAPVIIQGTRFVAAIAPRIDEVYSEEEDDEW